MSCCNCWYLIIGALAATAAPAAPADQLTSWPSWPSWVDQLTATAPGDLIHFLVCQPPGPGTYSSIHCTGGSQHRLRQDDDPTLLFSTQTILACDGAGEHSTGQAAATCVVRWLLTGKLFIIAGVRSLAGHSHAVTRHALLSRVNSAAAERRLRTEAASRGSSACSTAALQHLVHTAASSTPSLYEPLHWGNEIFCCHQS